MNKQIILYITRVISFFSNNTDIKTTRGRTIERIIEDKSISMNKQIILYITRVISFFSNTDIKITRGRTIGRII